MGQIAKPITTNETYRGGVDFLLLEENEVDDDNLYLTGHLWFIVQDPLLTNPESLEGFVVFR